VADIEVLNFQPFSGAPRHPATCRDEKQQRELLDGFSGEGLDGRGLLSLVACKAGSMRLLLGLRGRAGCGATVLRTQQDHARQQDHTCQATRDCRSSHSMSPE
jgi:hypothetical protein